jgi:chromosome segregation ATPase
MLLQQQNQRVSESLHDTQRVLCETQGELTAAKERLADARRARRTELQEHKRVQYAAHEARFSKRAARVQATCNKRVQVVENTLAETVRELHAERTKHVAAKAELRRERRALAQASSELQLQTDKADELQRTNRSLSAALAKLDKSHTAMKGYYASRKAEAKQRAAEEAAAARAAKGNKRNRPVKMLSEVGPRQRRRRLKELAEQAR